jgi:ankyrin repeat protein
MPKAPNSIYDAAKLGLHEEVIKQFGAGVEFSKEHLFDCAVQDFRTTKRTFGHIEILKFTYDLGLTPLSRIGWMNQPILCACAMYGNIELVEYILSKNKPEDAMSNAAIGNVDYFSEAENLRDIGKTFDKNGFTPLHYCASSSIGNSNAEKKTALTAISRILIENGVNPNIKIKNKLDLHPLFLCSWFGGNEEILKLLLQGGISQTDAGSVCIEFALEPHQRSGEPYYHIAECFLQAGWDINFKDGSNGRTLLHGAANRGSLKPTQWLLEHGADVAAIDGNGKTPLHVAAERNTSSSVIFLLLKHGAEINKADNFGRAPLFYAKQNNRAKVVRYLEENGARE